MPKPIPIALLAACLAAISIARADSTASALINRELDSQQSLDLHGTLPAAIEQIGNVSGVPVEVDPRVWDLLPWGQQTEVTAKITGHTLRDALTAITQKLGLTWTLTDEVVELRPCAALVRLGRRSTVEELESLDQLRSLPLHETDLNPTVSQLLDAVDAQLQAGKTDIVVENRAPDPADQSRVHLARNATLADALNAVADQTTATWYPWGHSVVVLGGREQIRTQLGKIISTRFDGTDVSQVLQDLFHRAGVSFTVDAGAYQRVPAEARSVRLALEDTSVQQALESIGGSTGLSFEVTDRGVHVSNAFAEPTGASGAASATQP